MVTKPIRFNCCVFGLGVCSLMMNNPVVFQLLHSNKGCSEHLHLQRSLSASTVLVCENKTNVGKDVHELDLNTS